MWGILYLLNRVCMQKPQTAMGLGLPVVVNR